MTRALAKQSFDFLSKDWSQRLCSLGWPRCRIKHRNLRALRMVNRTSSNKTSLVTLEGASYGWSSPSTTIRGPNPWHIFQYRPDLIGKFPWELRTPHALPSAHLLIGDEPGDSGDNRPQGYNIAQLTCCGLVSWVEHICKIRKEEFIGCWSSLGEPRSRSCSLPC